MKNLKRIGNIITIFAVIFLVYKLLKLGLDLELFFSKEGALVLFFTILAYTFSAFSSSFPWMKLLSIWEPKKIAWKNASYTYVRSNLFKYIPGNVFQYVGRNQLAIENDMSHVNVLMASFLEILCIVASAVIFSIAICGKRTLDLIQEFGWKNIPLFIILLLLLLCVGLIAKKKYGQKFEKYIFTNFTQFKTLRTWRLIFLTVIFYLFIFTIQSAMFYTILNFCAPNAISLELLGVVMGAYVLSWLIGYITPGSPGGLGVRELVLLSMLSQTLIQEDTIALSLMVMRGSNIIGDVLAYVSSVFIAHKSNCYVRKENV